MAMLNNQMVICLSLDFTVSKFFPQLFDPWGCSNQSQMTHPEPFRKSSGLCLGMIQTNPNFPVTSEIGNKRDYTKPDLGLVAYLTGNWNMRES